MAFFPLDQRCRRVGEIEDGARRIESPLKPTQSPDILPTMKTPSLALLLLGGVAEAADPTYEPSAGIAAVERLEAALAESQDDEAAIEAIALQATELRRAGQACSEEAAPRVEALRSELEILGEPEPGASDHAAPARPGPFAPTR